MSNLKSSIESMLFISTKPLSAKKLAEILECKKEEVEAVLGELTEEYKERNGGVQILKRDKDYQMATSPGTAKLVQDFIKDETTGELTRPQLETLTIVAYRGPISKPELDQIRGVNCSLILRNLMIRGLVEEMEENKTKRYNITFDFLRYLGVREVSELPDYERLHSSDILTRLLEQQPTPSLGGV